MTKHYLLETLKGGINVLYWNENLATIKMYNENYYKLTVMRKVLVRGQKIPFRRAKCSVNTEKLACNLRRAKSKVLEYCLCNDFDYFVTLTIDKNKYDRYDFSTYYKALSKFLNNYNINNNTKVQYVLIPEQHKDGAWHMHGVIRGVLSKHLKLNKNGYFEWTSYCKKFGYMGLSPIKSRNKVASYVTKYITKQMAERNAELNAHLYYVSKKLNTAWELKRGDLVAASHGKFTYDFINEHVAIKVFDNDECLAYVDEGAITDIEELEAFDRLFRERVNEKIKNIEENFVEKYNKDNSDYMEVVEDITLFELYCNCEKETMK